MARMRNEVGAAIKQSAMVTKRAPQFKVAKAPQRTGGTPNLAAGLVASAQRAKKPSIFSRAAATFAQPKPTITVPGKPFLTGGGLQTILGPEISGACQPGYHKVYAGTRSERCVPDTTFTVTPQPASPFLTSPSVASSSDQAILSAASGGALMPTVAPGQPAAPESEVEMVEVEVPDAPSAGGGNTAVLLGAGAGFLVGGPIGAIVGAVVGGAAGRKAAAAPEENLPVGWAAIDAVAFGGFWSSAKKLGKKIGKAAKKVGTFVAAPVVLPTAAVVKAASWGLSKTGAKPFVKLESKAASLWRSDTGAFARKAYGAQLAIGAAVGGAILAAPAVGAAVSSVGTSGVSLSTLGTAAGVVKGAIAAGAGAPSVEEEVVALSSGQPAGGAGASGMGPALAGALGGGLLGGPIGALAGGAAGYFLGQRKG